MHVIKKFLIIVENTGRLKKLKNKPNVNEGELFGQVFSKG